MSPSEPYWQKRLLLNLMLANQGMYLAAAVAIVGAVIKAYQQRGAFPIFGLTLATCVYTLVTVPILTPRDTAHVIPRLLAAVLIVIGVHPDLNVPKRMNSDEPGPEPYQCFV